MQIESPIKHLSYSAVQAFLGSPRIFWRTYVAHAPFQNRLVSSVGKAWHKGVEEFLRLNSSYIEEARIKLTQEATKIKDLSIVDFNEEITDLIKNLELYSTIQRDWEPLLIPNKDTGELLPCLEMKVSMASPVEGGLPITGRIDCIDQDYGVTDHKYVGRFGQHPKEFYYVQAWFNYHLGHHLTGHYPAYFRVSEWKQSKNRDGSPQLKERIVIYEDSWMKKLDEWYIEISKQILNQVTFVANPFHPFDTQDWYDYLNN